MLKSFTDIQYAEPGFDDQNLLTFQLTLPEDGFETPLENVTFFDSFKDELRALPAVFAVMQVLESVIVGLTSGWLVFVPLVMAGCRAGFGRLLGFRPCRN